MGAPCDSVNPTSKTVAIVYIAGAHVHKHMPYDSSLLWKKPAVYGMRYTKLEQYCELHELKLLL